MKTKMYYFKEFGFPVDLAVVPWSPLPLLPDTEKEWEDPNEREMLVAARLLAAKYLSKPLLTSLNLS
eukprot:1348411-Pyramimonas_sp.AAC.1